MCPVTTEQIDTILIILTYMWCDYCEIVFMHVSPVSDVDIMFWGCRSVRQSLWNVLLFWFVVLIDFVYCLDGFDLSVPRKVPQEPFNVGSSIFV